MVAVAGVGPGDLRYLTLEVYEAIKKAHRVVAFGRVGQGVRELREDLIIVSRVKDCLDLAQEEGDLLILASGDPLFFGVVAFLKRSGVDIARIYPGISSFQYLSAQLQIPWQEAHLFSLHGRDMDLKELLDKPLSIGLTDKKTTPNVLSRALGQLGAQGRIIAGSYLSYGDKEVIEERKIGEDFSLEEGLSVVVIELEMD
ncbi:MAG: precorrin-6y C5,15-methyltransferase (decarboxylating) subunit CbiE [Tissierellia bacterium]|nr:precorrin-6y C5,15-methyltransferase (decarboxylating) subunit CbiE [Tissierellia bacterium]